MLSEYVSLIKHQNNQLHNLNCDCLSLRSAGFQISFEATHMDKIVDYQLIHEINVNVN